MTRTLFFVAACMSFILPNAAEPVVSRDKSPPVAGSYSPLPPANAQLSIESKGVGALEGTVAYRPDPGRPWKLSRYYVANSKLGWLAEAVVALDGPNLAQSAPKEPAQSQSMDQVNFQFVPETLALRAGDWIKIMNSDDALHNVMTLDGSKPFNVSLAKGQEFTHCFDRAGGLANPIRLGCLFHGQMHARVYVFDHPWFAVTKRDGQFRFDHVPPGSYTLGAVHPAGRLHWSRTVEVKADEKASVSILLTPDDVAGLK